MRTAALPDGTRVSRVHLRTANLERALGFYEGVLGLLVLSRDQGSATLGSAQAGPVLIQLSEDRQATPRPSGCTGLYHLALRYPTRRDLARVLQRLARDNWPVSGASDHLVSEAIYLNDADGNGVELCTDRPRNQWKWQGDQVLMSTERLDVDDLLATLEGEPAKAPWPPAVDLGHIHLHVADLQAAERFYHDYLGLAVTQREYPGALFLSAGRYHHHVAVNTWSGRLPPPANAIGLISYRLEVPVEEVLYCLRNRAPLSGYEARPAPGREAGSVLQIRDPNGHWLEVENP